MLNDDELGELLRRDLHAFADGIEPGPGFWDRFMPDPAPRRRRRRLLRITAPVTAALVGLIVAAILVFGGSSPPAAYAVTVSGSTITITLRQVAAIHALNRELIRLKLPDRAVPLTSSCPTHLDLTYIGEVERGVSATRLTRIHVPANVHVIIAARQSGPGHVTFAFGRVKGPVPSCVSAKGTGVGLPGFHGTIHHIATGNP